MRAQSQHRSSTDGIRGLPSHTWNEQHLLSIAVACAVNLNSNGKIVIGFDGRAGSSELALLCAQQFKNMDIDFLLSDSVTATPAVGRLCATDAAIGGGIMFTASHNPPGYVGVKVRDNHGNAYDMSELCVVYDEHPFLGQAGTQGTLQRTGAINENYIESVVSILDMRAQKFNGDVVVDPMFGACARFRDNTKHVSWLRGVSAPFFFGITPDPVIEVNGPMPDSFDYLSDTELRVLTDGDGDRISMITRRSGYISSTEIALSFLLAVPQTEVLITTVVAECLARTLCESTQRLYLETEVGFHNIATAWRNRDRIPAIGLEPNGGVALGSTSDSYFERDGLGIAAQILTQFKSVAEIDIAVQEVRDNRRFTQRLLNVSASPDELRDSFLRKYEQFRPTTRGRTICLTDGNGQRILLRRSGTESVTRVYLEAASESVSWFESWRCAK